MYNNAYAYSIKEGKQVICNKSNVNHLFGSISVLVNNIHSSLLLLLLCCYHCLYYNQFVTITIMIIILIALTQVFLILIVVLVLNPILCCMTVAYCVGAQ